MKASAVVRIIIYSLIVIILLGLLTVAIRGGGVLRWFDWDFDFGNNNNSGGYLEYDSEDLYTIGGGSVDGKNISDIKIDWLDGNIEISPHDKDTIEFEESSKVSLDPDYRMRYYVDGGTLKIHYAKSRVIFTGIFRSMDKALTVKVPRDIYFDKVKVDSVSSSQSISGISAKQLSFETVSGKVALNQIIGEDIKVSSISGRFDGSDIKAGKFKIDAVSGKTEIWNSEIKELDIDSVSGNIEVQSITMPYSVSMETVSGSMTLTIPENDGFRVDIDKISGSFNCDFAVTMQGKNNAVYKNGGAEIDFDTVSGSMTIRKG